MVEFDVPILFVIFNRPETTQKVFESIKLIKPSRLYVAADGPRDGNEQDIENCKRARKIIEQVDWDCKIDRLFREENLGCGKAVSGAINWFFEQVDKGIILEDDCLPDTSFFNFCRTLLNYYENDERIMHIGGTNFQRGNKRGLVSYYFSANVHVWGWATWRRAWKKYDFDVSDVEDFIGNNKIQKYFSDSVIKDYWYTIFRNMRQHKIDTWDYQWLYSVWNNGGLAIIPQINLVSNIGFGSTATHTQGENEWANMVTGSITDIRHPVVMGQNKEADLYTFYSHYAPPSLPKLGIIKRIVKRIGF
jgi:GT2 family glycosyltransferase